MRSGWKYRDVVEQVAESGRFLKRWSVGPHRNISPGTEAWLVLQGSSAAGSGLIGHGVVVSEPYEPVHYATPDVSVSVAFDALLPLGEQIRPDVLSAAVPEVTWAPTDGSSTVVPPAAEFGLRQLWRDQGPAAVDPAELVPGTYPPQAISSIVVNRYERDSDARRVCLAFHGTSCAACGFSFEAAFGDIGTGFIDVHHVVPPAMIGTGYQLDPIADLVPLCPNCHAMAHLAVRSPRSVSELRSIISASGHLTGDMVTDLSLEAQEDARRILEGHASLKDLG
jgi:5-methylcytosine-specific restriction protein A